MSIDLQSHLKKIEDLITEVPKAHKLVFPTLLHYQLHQAILEMTKADEPLLGRLTIENNVPREALIFRGTDLKRYSAENVLDCWWTYNLRKATNYARKSQDPVLLVGTFEDIISFEKTYTDEAIFLMSSNRYKGQRILKPLYADKKHGSISVPILVGFQQV